LHKARKCDNDKNNDDRHNSMIMPTTPFGKGVVYCIILTPCL
jgi:hypothetical protein